MIQAPCAIPCITQWNFFSPMACLRQLEEMRHKERFINAQWDEREMSDVIFTAHEKITGKIT